MSARVALLFIAFIVPLSGAAAILIAQQSGRMALTDRERGGVRYTERTIALVRDLRALRDRMLFDGGAGARERRNVSVALAALVDDAHHSDRASELARPLHRLEAQWRRVPGGRVGEAEVEKVLGAATGLFDGVDERAALSTDPDAVTALFLDAYAQLPTVSEEVDRAKLILAWGIRGPDSHARERIAAAVAIGQARHAYEVASSDVSIAAA
ncbi:MAG: hypothetical protein IAI49_14350, partial [Candidatus Eremiobacteraeota bacterium]|nr:hypothetical protein [Candidatus Eremiobacteraeota bacterium]